MRTETGGGEFYRTTTRGEEKEGEAAEEVEPKLF
jgi:hypothetical protein